MDIIERAEAFLEYPGTVVDGAEIIEELLDEIAFLREGIDGLTVIIDDLNNIDDLELDD